MGAFMAKANIETRQGTKITVEGSSEEVAAILSSVERRESPHHSNSSTNAEQKLPESSGSLKSVILQFREDGVFNTPQKVADITRALEQKAQFYSSTSVSTALIRLVQNGHMGRIKIGGDWAYVKR